MKNNKQYEEGQNIKVKFKSWGTILCQFVSPVGRGYTKCIVKDIQPDNPTSGKDFWSRGTNLGFGQEHEIHVNQIENAE